MKIGTNKKSLKSTKSKKASYEVGSVIKLNGGDEIRITEWKKRATFGFFDAADIKRSEDKGGEPFPTVSFQVRKAKIVLSVIDHIKGFVDANASKE